jgi:hypothetical protein
VDRTELAPSTPISDREVDEGARPLAMPRFDRTMLAAPNQDLPRGPMGWNDGQAQDPLTQTQKSTPTSASALTSTQKSPTSALEATQRSPSAAFPTVGSVPSNNELRRPEMRSPSPRPASTPRSLWIPVLVVLIVVLAGTAVWLFLNAAGAATPTSPDAAPSAPGETTPATPRPSPPVVEPETKSADDSPAPTPERGSVEAPDGTEPAAAPASSAGTEPSATEPHAGADEPDPPALPDRGDRPRRPRRPSKASGTRPSPDPDIPEIKPGRPVPP